MSLARLALLLLVTGLAGCGGDKALECDSGPYMTAVRTEKVQAPDGLDDLDPLNEVPLPAASPQGPRAEDAPCLDFPPSIIRIR